MLKWVKISHLLWRLPSGQKKTWPLPFGNDQRSCPSMANECQKMAGTSTFLPVRRRYLWPHYPLRYLLLNFNKRNRRWGHEKCMVQIRLLWGDALLPPSLMLFSSDPNHRLPLSVTVSLTDWLRHSYFNVDLIDVILVCEVANSILVDIVIVDAEKRVGNSLV